MVTSGTTKSTKLKSDLLDLVGRDFEISRGTPVPLGSSIRPTGINFAVFSRHATAVALVLFKPGDTKPLAEFPFDPRFNRTGDIWHALIRGLPPSIEYGYRLKREPNAEPDIHRFDPAAVIIDPHARAFSGGEIWGMAGKPDAPAKWHSLIVDDDFDWGFDQPLNIPMAETIIYELHVRGFTNHPSAGTGHPGTYTGLTEKIPYLQKLGITAVELLPINEFAEADTDLVNPETNEPLRNYWGYNTVGFFAPKSSYASQPDGRSAVSEFKGMVKAFHEAGIEIILDVVFNHTAEGDQRGPTISFRGLDNSVYYLIDPEDGRYHNFTGCGNTLNCNHPVVRDMILECLRYWVTEMHVDGFRFDLASVLGRGRDGSVLANPPLLERIAADPILGNTKLIAEAWDAAGLYQVGSFPAWGRWAEWNGRFRDDVRQFVKSDPGLTKTLAERLSGSPDLYADDGRQPHHSINFVTCHDGFTLADLVSYDAKHNIANGEEGRDGSDHNLSWNCGVEGPTRGASDDHALSSSIREVERRRRRQMRNFATILMLSRGVPMILAGDEFGRTQHGNNNAYCQDNEISWLDWELVEQNSDLLRFFRLLIAFRKTHPFLTSVPVSDDAKRFPVTWHGLMLNKPDWSDESRALAMQVTEELDGVPRDTYLAINAHWEASCVELPPIAPLRHWHRVVDTSLESPEDICAAGDEPRSRDQQAYRLGPRSVVVLLGR